MIDPRDALLRGAESLRGEAESIRSGLQPLTESDIAAARDAEAAAASLEALAADADALRADAESSLRRLEAVADGETDDFPEDRVSRLGGAADVRDFAATLLDAIEGERLRIAAAACGILARRILADPDLLSTEDRGALAAAIRADWHAPDR